MKGGTNVRIKRVNRKSQTKRVKSHGGTAGSIYTLIKILIVYKPTTKHVQFTT